MKKTLAQLSWMINSMMGNIYYKEDITQGKGKVQAHQIWEQINQHCDQKFLN